MWIFKEKFDQNKINAQIFPKENGTDKPAPLRDQKCQNEKDRIGKNGSGKDFLRLPFRPNRRQKEGERCREHKRVRTPKVYV